MNLFILNEDVINIIKIIKSLEDSDVLIDGITETAKYEIIIITIIIIIIVIIIIIKRKQRQTDFF